MARYRVIALADAQGWELDIRDDHNQIVGAAHSATLEDAHLLVREHLAVTDPAPFMVEIAPVGAGG